MRPRTRKRRKSVRRLDADCIRSCSDSDQTTTSRQHFYDVSRGVCFFRVIASFLLRQAIPADACVQNVRSGDSPKIGQRLFCCCRLENMWKKKSIESRILPIQIVPPFRAGKFFFALALYLFLYFGYANVRGMFQE